MDRDAIWNRLKEDDSLVYGEPIMDAFLKMTTKMERRHWDGLPASKKSLVSGQCMLNFAETPEEAEAAIKKGGGRLGSIVKERGATRRLPNDEVPSQGES